MRVSSFFLAFWFALLANLSFSCVRAAQHAAPVRVAPADEYFGRLKLSILGIRNQLHDLRQRLDYASIKDGDVLGSAAFVADALHDWERKYPADPWLPQDVYQLAELYARLHGPSAHACALQTFHWLESRYRRSHYAALARTEIGQFQR